MVNVQAAASKLGGEAFSFPDSVTVGLTDPRQGSSPVTIAGCVLTESALVFFDAETREVLRVARSALENVRRITPVGYSGMSSAEITANGRLSLEFTETQGWTGYTSADVATQFQDWLHRRGVPKA